MITFFTQNTLSHTFFSCSQLVRVVIVTPLLKAQVQDEALCAHIIAQHVVHYTFCKEYTSYYRKLATKTVSIQQEELQEH